MTYDDFIKKAREKHGDKYDYSKVEYKNNTTKVCIICPEHGEFWQMPKTHLKGGGCPKCAHNRTGLRCRSTLEEFVQKAKEVHGDKYDYSKVEYKNNITKVCIICPEHGEFWIRPANHIHQKQGCPKCGNRYRYSTEEWITKAREVHGDKYDYSKVEYKNNDTKVCIICHKKDENEQEHGEFWQKPVTHISGFGCSKCSHNYKLTTQEFIYKANSIYNNKYIYDKVKYVNNSSPVIITCPIHGDFEQTPKQHLKGTGCPRCNGTKIFTEDFIKKAKVIHGDKYDYSKTIYQKNWIPVEIICNKHGSFWQTPHEHLDGCGCPKCSVIISNSEIEIADFIKYRLNLTIECQNKTLLNGKEIDIYIPSKKIGIEYNGLLWHSEKFGKDAKYHLYKTEECNKIGINLIQIFEDEYINHKNIVLEKLRHILGKDNNKEKVYARKCIIKLIATEYARDFLNLNHIQGFVPSTLYLGAFYENNLMGVMTFKEEKKGNGMWELTRFATDISKRCIGLGGKLFSYFLKTYNPINVKSFADRRWTINSEDNLYTKLGFELETTLPPDYRYFYNREYGINRVHKFNFRKNILHKKYGFPLDMTESEMCNKLGAYRIWDCGLYKFVWKNNNI